MVFLVSFISFCWMVGKEVCRDKLRPWVIENLLYGLNQIHARIFKKSKKPTCYMATVFSFDLRQSLWQWAVIVFSEYKKTQSTQCNSSRSAKLRHDWMQYWFGGTCVNSNLTEIFWRTCILSIYALLTHFTIDIISRLLAKTLGDFRCTETRDV